MGAFTEPVLFLAAIAAFVVLEDLLRGWIEGGSANRHTRGAPADVPGNLDYKAMPLLRGASERAAWAEIRRHAPSWVFAVCPKVRLEDILEAQGHDRGRQRLRGYVKSRHVDFLVVDVDWRPRLVIEVDGGSHRRPDRQRRDALVDRALASAGVPILRLRVGEDWAPKLRNRFRTPSIGA